MATAADPLPQNPEFLVRGGRSRCCVEAGKTGPTPTLWCYESTSKCYEPTVPDPIHWAAAGSPPDAGGGWREDPDSRVCG